jgi:hypothetical protein
MPVTIRYRCGETRLVADPLRRLVVRVSVAWHQAYMLIGAEQGGHGLRGDSQAKLSTGARAFHRFTQAVTLLGHCCNFVLWRWIGACM